MSGFDGYPESKVSKTIPLQALVSVELHQGLTDTSLHRPGSTNTVPGNVQFSLDIRSKEDATVLQLEKLLKDEFENIARGEEVDGMNSQGTKGKGCSVDWQLDTNSPATKFHEDCIKCVEKSAAAMIGTESGNQVQRMTSGAGHDR
jgi:metal-dependent amidase/aminoacylase/carboxypeptidase family protein